MMCDYENKNIPIVIYKKDILLGNPKCKRLAKADHIDIMGNKPNEKCGKVQMPFAYCYYPMGFILTE